MIAEYYNQVSLLAKTDVTVVPIPEPMDFGQTFDQYPHYGEIVEGLLMERMTSLHIRRDELLNTLQNYYSQNPKTERSPRSELSIRSLHAQAQAINIRLFNLENIPYEMQLGRKKSAEDFLAIEALILSYVPFNRDPSNTDAQHREGVFFSIEKMTQIRDVLISLSSPTATEVQQYIDRSTCVNPKSLGAGQV